MHAEFFSTLVTMESLSAVLEEKKRAKEAAQEKVGKCQQELRELTAAAQLKKVEEKKALNKIEVAKDDVEYVARELKMPPAEAKLSLQKNGGDLQKTIEVLVGASQ